MGEVGRIKARHSLDAKGDVFRMLEVLAGVNFDAEMSLRDGVTWWTVFSTIRVAGKDKHPFPPMPLT